MSETGASRTWHKGCNASRRRPNAWRCSLNIWSRRRNTFAKQLNAVKRQQFRDPPPYKNCQKNRTWHGGNSCANCTKSGTPMDGMLLNIALTYQYMHGMRIASSVSSTTSSNAKIVERSIAGTSKNHSTVADTRTSQTEVSRMSPVKRRRNAERNRTSTLLRCNNDCEAAWKQRDGDEE